MDLATIIGLCAGFSLIIWALLMGGSVLLFLDIPSLIIVLGGTTTALLSNFPLDRVKGVLGVLRKTLFHKALDPNEVIAKMVTYAERARKEGMLALEEDSEQEPDEFLRKGLRLAVDGTDP